MDPPQTAMSPVAPSGTFMPTTDEDYPRFRLLIVGRSGVGKSTLINAIFKAPLAEVQHDRAGAANINEGITSPHNKHLILHDSQGYEPGDQDKFRVLEKFITEWTRQQSPSERLHATWLCVPASYSGGRLFETGEETIFKLNRNKVPVVIVITKFDLYMAAMQRRSKNKISYQSAEDDYKKKYDRQFRNTRMIQGQIQYALVSRALPRTLSRLVQITEQSIDPKSTGFMRIWKIFSNWDGENSRATKSSSDSSNLAQALLAAAQGINTQPKIDASIKAGEEQYWSSAGFWATNISLQQCIFGIHKELIAIWIIRGSYEFLFSDIFCRQMMVVVDDLADENPTRVAMGLAGAWTTGVKQSLPEHVRCLMGYVVDITLVLQALFRLQLSWDKSEIPDNVHAIIHDFHSSEKKSRIHGAIRIFVGGQQGLAKDIVMGKIASLIKENEPIDSQLDNKVSTLSSVLTTVRFELAATGSTVNQVILDLVGRVLALPDYRDIISKMDPFDTELLLDLTLYLLRNGNLLNSGVQDSNSKIRRMMLNLISENDILPRSLFITGVKTGNSGIGGHWNIRKGEYGGQPVVLKELYKSKKEGLLGRREALVRRSLPQRFVLPLLGIFRDESGLFLVSPFMTNATLTQWRKNKILDPREIQTRILEVAKGVQYIHSEGIVHGSLRGENILLDSEFHCQIGDFGLAQPSEDSALQSDTESLNYTAPELFSIYDRRPTDVYAFGCLYYAIYFDTVPFNRKKRHEIIRFVSSEVHPPRLNSPEMDDSIWDLICQCWTHNPFKRPTMEQIVMKHMTLTPLSALIVTLCELTALGSSVVNEITLQLLCKLLELPESHTTVSELRTTSDIELLLDFILLVLRNGDLTKLNVKDANKKARRLMFRLISVVHVIPKSLFITGVKTEMHLGLIGIGGFGRVFKGEHEGRKVALKVVDRGRSDDSLKRDLRREVLAWRSLVHRFILPLLGIFEEKSQLFLISPFMINGTLTQWRKKQKVDVLSEVNRLMLEVAEGINYLHSEGIIHGDLHGRNVLLDSEFHCQITDFGSTRHSEATVLRPTTALTLNFAAPELFGICAKCGQPDCDGCPSNGDRDVEYTSKTMETDVYAFGCLYYATFFDTVPFHGYNDHQVVRFVTNGKRPDLLKIPRMADNTWSLIQSSWDPVPFNRPTMEQITTLLISIAQAGS